MKNYILKSLFGLIFLNSLLYLAIEINKLFSYLLLSIIFLICYIFFEKLSIEVNKKRTINNQSDSSKTESAEDHPIIKAARRRLGK